MTVREECKTTGCTSKVATQGHCQRCARAAGIMHFPQCALEGCTRRAQARTSGSYCRPCRQTAPNCEREGCTNPTRVGDTMCRRCRTRFDIPDRGGLCVENNCPNLGQKGPGKSKCDKHHLHPGSCIRQRCIQPAVRNCKCEKHQSHATECVRCGRSRYKATLCYRCHRNTYSRECGHATCPRRTIDVYCRVHDVGIDFAAGDWFDWVAVERLYWGRQGARQPTVPELRAVVSRADREGVHYTTLARQMGMEPHRLDNWRLMIDRLESVAA